MERPISTKAHGVIDWTWATAAGSASQWMEAGPSTARLIRNAAAAAGLNSLCTNYEAGALRVLPMKAHLSVDALICAALVLSPFFLPRVERRHAVVPILLGAVGLMMSLLTQTETPRQRGFNPSRELSEAVADPDIARTTHVRSHLE
jgi:hypothetical protein